MLVAEDARCVIKYDMDSICWLAAMSTSKILQLLHNVQMNTILINFMTYIGALLTVSITFFILILVIVLKYIVGWLKHFGSIVFLLVICNNCFAVKFD